MRSKDFFGGIDRFFVDNSIEGLICDCPECRSARGEDFGGEVVLGKTVGREFSSEEVMLQDFDKIPGVKYDDRGAPIPFWVFGEGKSMQLWVPLDHFMELRKVLELNRKIAELRKEADEKPEAVKVFSQILAGDLNTYETLPESWKKRVDVLVKKIFEEALKLTNLSIMEILSRISVPQKEYKYTEAATEINGFMSLFISEKERAVFILRKLGEKPFENEALSELNNTFEAFRKEVLDPSVRSIEEKIKALEAEKETLLKSIPVELHDAKELPIKKLTPAQLRDAVKNFVCEEEAGVSEGTA